MARRRSAGEGSVHKRANGTWRARRSIGPRGAQTHFSATATTRHGALDLLADRIAAFEDGLITATTRKAYVGQVNNHIICYPEWGSLRELSGAKVRTGRRGSARPAALVRQPAGLRGRDPLSDEVIITLSERMGLRRAESSGLRICDLDLDRRLLTADPAHRPDAETREAA